MIGGHSYMVYDYMTSEYVYLIRCVLRLVNKAYIVNYQRFNNYWIWTFKTKVFMSQSMSKW
jgi:hypothetical protein